MCYELMESLKIAIFRDALKYGSFSNYELCIHNYELCLWNSFHLENQIFLLAKTLLEQ